MQVIVTRLHVEVVSMTVDFGRVIIEVGCVVIDRRVGVYWCDRVCGSWLIDRNSRLHVIHPPVVSGITTVVSRTRCLINGGVVSGASMDMPHMTMAIIRISTDTITIMVATMSMAMMKVSNVPVPAVMMAAMAMVRLGTIRRIR